MTFVGRSRELERLARLMRGVEQGEGGAALIRGEPGIGKSSLASQFASRIGADATVLWGACLDSDAAPAFGPWRFALESPSARAQVLSALTSLGAEAAPLAPLVSSFDVRGAHLPPVPLDARDSRVRLYDAVVSLFRELARRRPLVVVVDDLQWIDRDSRELLDYLLALLPRERWLFVCVTRDTSAPDSVALIAAVTRTPRHEHCELEGLGRDDATAMIEALLGRAASAAVVATIHDETHGVPFYVQELVRALDEDAAAKALPKSVHDAINARLARLSVNARDLLAVVALLSRPPHTALLAGVMKRPLADVLDVIEEVVRAGLLRNADAGRYELSHAIFRRALLEAMLPDRQAILRRALAEMLATRDQEDDAGEIAAQYHLSRAHPGADAGAPYAVRAAMSAERGGAHDRAARYFRMAIDLGAPARAQLQTKLALAAASAQEFDESVRAARDALAAGAVAADMHIVIRVLKNGGAAPSIWEPLLDECLAKTATHDLAWARLAALMDRIEPVASGPWYVSTWTQHDAAAISALRASGFDSDLATTVSPFALRTREETEALAACAQSMQASSDRIAVLDAVIRDWIHRHADYRRARAAAAALLDESRRIGHVAGEAEALYELAKCDAISGDLASARQHAAAVPALVARLGSAHRLHFTSLTALEIEIRYFGGGDWSPIAAESVQFARDPKCARTPMGLIGMAFGALASALAGDRATATEIVVALIPILARVDARAYQRKQAIDLAAIAVFHLGLHERAAAYRELLLGASPGEGTAPITCTDLGLARMAALGGDRRETQRRYARARAWAKDRGARPLAAIAQYEQAIAGGAKRGMLAARADAEEALAVFAALGMKPWTEEAQRAGLAVRALPDGLTLREAEVLALVASGLANKDVARRLRISAATVQRHLANAYAKIGVTSRTQATSYVLRVGLSYMAGPTRSA